MKIEQDEFTPLETRLASLRPRGPNLDRDRLMFLAGQASVAYWPERRRGSFGSLVLTAAVAVAATALLLTITESASRIVDRAVAASTHVSQRTGSVQGHPSPPPFEQFEYRVEMGNWLGMYLSFLIGQKPIEIDSERSSRSIGRLRKELLEEGMPDPAERRAVLDEASAAETEG